MFTRNITGADSKQFNISRLALAGTLAFLAVLSGASLVGTAALFALGWVASKPLINSFSLAADREIKAHPGEPALQHFSSYLKSTFTVPAKACMRAFNEAVPSDEAAPPEETPAQKPEPVIDHTSCKMPASDTSSPKKKALGL